jgi:hypothetical protein
MTLSTQFGPGFLLMVRAYTTAVPISIILWIHNPFDSVLIRNWFEIVPSFSWTPSNDLTDVLVFLAAAFRF